MKCHCSADTHTHTHTYTHTYTHRCSPDPAGRAKKMHMQRKGRFLVVSYEDVVSAAKAAAVAAIVASGGCLVGGGSVGVLEAHMSGG